MERIGREVEKELARGGSRDALPLASVTAVWQSVVGDAVARQAWPLRIGRDGTLHVATTSSTWAFELDRLSPQIVEGLAAKMGSEAPLKMRFAVGPVPETGPGTAALAAAGDRPRATPEEAAEADAAAAAIADPELRELVARAARAGLARARSGRRF